MPLERNHWIIIIIVALILIAWTLYNIYHYRPKNDIAAILARINRLDKLAFVVHIPENELEPPVNTDQATVLDNINKKLREIDCNCLNKCSTDSKGSMKRL
jgi:hypothetical protein